MLGAVVLKLEQISELPGGLVPHRRLGLALRASDSVGLGSGLRTSISNKFLGDVDVAGLGTTF